jgi:hypothetical protein
MAELGLYKGGVQDAGNHANNEDREHDAQDPWWHKAEEAKCPGVKDMAAIGTPNPSVQVVDRATRDKKARDGSMRPSPLRREERTALWTLLIIHGNDA